MKRVSLAFSVFLMVSLSLFFSCGLPKTIFLSEPGFSSTGAYQFVLTHNIDNYDIYEGVDQSFKGYEIFYRGYDSESAAQAVVNALQANIGIYESSPNQFKDAATNLGFVRMKAAETSVEPLISINAPDSASTATLEISTTNDWLMTLREPNPDESFFVVRNVSDYLRNSFYNNANYLSIDINNDYTGVNAPATVYFVLFAVAYGEDPEAIGQKVYSLPDDMIASLAPNGNIVSFP